jgi:hypothetical protein
MTPAQLLAELDGRARAAIVRSGRFAQEAIDSARRLAREADARVGARWLRWQAVLRPRLNAGAAKIEGAAALLTARLQHSATVSERLLGSLVGFTRRIAAALDHARTRWQAVMQRRLDALAVLSRRGIAQLLVHAEPCRQVLHRTLKSATGSAARGISVARDRLVRWRRR